MRPIVKGSTDQSVIVRIVDSSDGTPETGVVFNSAGLDMWYRREGGLEVSITEATLAAANSAHSDGGFIHISDGYYRVDLPDAAVATGANGVMVGGAMTDMVVIGCYVPLWDINPYDAVRAGLTALPNAAADAAGGLIISDAGGLDADAQLVTKINSILDDTGTSGVVLANDAITAAKIAADAIGSSELAASAVTEIAAAIASPSINTTTIATLASQTSFTLTAGSADDNAYNGCLVVITDASTAVQKAVGVISDYTGSTKTVTLLNDPAIFTMAVGDAIEIRPDRSLKPTVDNRTVDVDADGGVEVDTLQTGAQTEIADAILKRDWTSVSGEASRSVLNALRPLRNRVAIAGGTQTVYEEDDSTSAWTADVTTTAGDPISEIDPT